MIPFTPDERRAQFAPSQNVGGPVDPDILDIIGERPQPTMVQQVQYEVAEPRPIDPDVIEIVNQTQMPMMASLMGASQVNPDQAAEAKRLGSQIGIGQDIALRNLEDVRKRAFMADVQRRDIARANPVLAGFLSDPTFANEASDDIGALEQIGSFFADVGRAAAGQPLQYIPGELARGYMRGQRVAERGEIGTRAIMGEAEDTNFERAKQIQEELRSLSGGGILASTAEVVAQNVAQAREVVGAGLIGGAAGSVIPGLGTMAGFAGGLGTGVALTTAKIEAGNLYLDLKEQEINDETAVPVALGAGLLNGVIEAVGMKIAAAPFRQLASRVMREQIAEAVRKPTMRAALAQAGKAYAMQVGTEATEEGLQEIVNIAGEELAKGMEGIDSETTMRDAAKRVLDSFVQGAMGSAILGGIGPGANLYVDLRRAGKATKQTQFFNDLSQNATASKLKARDAGAYERFVAATADGTGADTVFVDGATMRDVLSQAGVTDAQLKAIVPGLAQRVRQAAEQGNDVTIPTAQFAARLAGTKLGDGLLPHMRLSPDAMSATEAQQFEQNREALVEEARALLESKTEAESAFVQEADQVATTMRERLIAAGRDPALAEVESLVHQAFVVTQAARQGKTPAQFEAESGLREIVGAEMPAAPLEQAARINGNEVQKAIRKYAKAQIDEVELIDSIGAWGLITEAEVNALLERDRDLADAGVSTRGGTTSVPNFGSTSRRRQHPLLKLIREREQSRERKNVGDQVSSIDADYMAAVERGDMEAAQRMVDSAAEQRMPNSVVRDDAGKLLRIYHGTQRIDRVGNRLLKKRATSGPMPFFTNTKAIAEGYAQGKQDTSIEDIGYEQWVKYKPKGQRSMVTLDQAWAYLTPEQRTTATERLFTVGYQNPDEGTGPIVTDTETIASRDHVQYLLREARGNALTAAKELWLNSGSLFNDEQQFMDVLNGMGLTEGFVYDSPHAVKSGVIEAYVNITNPLDTAAIPESVVAALQQRANRIRKPAAQYGRDPWDKEVRDPQSWMETLQTDIAEGKTTAWTSIPDWVTDVLRGLGYDGIKDTGGKFGGEQHTVWIPFEPEQVKFANTITKDGSGKIVPVLERFDITSPMMFRQAAVPAAFYSALGRAIDGIDIKSASASGWKERIKGLVNKGDIKQDELTWSGLEDWLSLPREGKITKEEVADFLKNNGVRVERVTLQDVRRITREGPLFYVEGPLDVVGRDAPGWFVRDADGSIEEGPFDSEAEAEQVSQQFEAEASSKELAARPLPTKYAQYTLPGGTNYREVLLTLPVDTEQRRAAQETYNRLVSEGVPLMEAMGRAQETLPKEFRSQHWTQPNVVAHLRMNDRVDADGKRVLFVEEVQSDWGQAGVKYGFVNQRAADEAELANLLMQQETKPSDALKKQIARVQARIKRGEYNVFRAPYVETTDGWLNLGLKQVLLEAVRGNYDRVAFVNGEQSKDRYDLSKEIESLSWTGYDSRGATKLVSLYPKQGNPIELPLDDRGVVVSTGNQFDGKELGEIVPKEIADQIMENRSGELAGDQLNVGGEGMKSFYDKIVPAAVNKLLKKYSGGKLGEIRLPYMLPKEMEADADRLGMTQADILEVAGEEDAYAQNQPGFDVTDALREKVASGLPLFQAMPGRGPARGGYDPSRLKILFGKGADFTTGAHELTHYYVDYYTKQAIAGTAAPQMLADLDIMFKFMGVAGATPEERLAAFNAMPFETARPLIETITYNAEIYLFEGKAPSLELAGVFDRMLAFFRRAYKSIADFVTQQRDIYRAEFGRELPELSDELRQVFDRMLADERQIKQAQAVAQMRGQFTVKPEGMDDAEWAAYQEMAGEATNAAIADMTKASLRQMEWLSRARSRIIKDIQARHTAQRKEVRERVQREVQQDPLYRAMAFLRRGQVVAPDGTVTEAEGVHRIDRVLAAEFAPTVDLARLGGRFGVLQDDGLHPDIVAEMFGFPAGVSLLQALADAKPMREVVEDRTDAEMLRLYGEMNTPEAREQEIQKALHNEARARLVGVELRFMGKVQQPVRVLLEAARQAAKQVIDRKIVRDIRPSEFVAAEAKASREATAAMQENKPDAAVRAKRAQLLNNQLAKAALEARDEIDNGVRYLRRVLRDSNRQRMGADVADQIASLLDRFNIAPMTADEARRVGTLAEFLASLEDRGLVPDIAEAIGMRDTRIPYKNMTIAEFRDLVDAVKQLEYIGKNERKILLAKEKAEFESVRDEIVASVIDNAGDRKANARTATTNIGRAVTAMKGFAAAHLKAASIVRILDGGKDGGPLWNYLIRSANEAGDSETSMRAEATADLTKILEPVFRAGKLGGKGVFFPTIDRAMNREARLVVALNMGNAGNMQRLLDGEGWSIESVMPVLQSLTEDELNTVQQIWDYFEKYRPMIGQKERRLYGKEPAWVDPQPLVVRSADGKTVTLRGGYYPIKYDPRASLRAETMSEADEAKRDLAGAYTTATTRRSFVKSRVRKVEGRPLLYTLAGMYGGINDVIHDLTWHEWLIQANRLMRSNSFDDAVRNRYGPEYVAQLKNWIKDVAAGERGVQNEAEMALNFLRQGISSAGLGFNIVSAIMQITGFNQSIVRVGAKWIGRGIAYTVTNPMLAMQEVNEKSEFMRNRSRTQFRELNEIRNMVQGQSIAMRRVQMGTYFLMMRMQRMVDVPTWHGAYEKAMHEGRDEETAIALADQAVIDSQGGGMVKDLARVERGGPAVKLFTVFYGYMNTVYNMAAVQTMTNKNKGRLAADYAMLFVVPVVLSYILKQALIPRKGDEEEEWDMGKIGRELAAEQLSYLMGTMVIAREFGEVGKMIFGVEGPRMGYGGPAGLRAIGETYQFATQASQGEFDTAFRKSAVNMIGAFTGLPSAQVNRTLDGLEALYEGETQNVLAPLTGAKKR